MGVHGNGLTALLWMQRSPQATVMEFFYPEGFVFDYESTARALGIKYYGFWDDTSVVASLFPKLTTTIFAGTSLFLIYPTHLVFLISFIQMIFQLMGKLL